jgi:hypothetical protein
VHQIELEVIQMLYQEKTLGQAGMGARFAAGLAMLFGRHRQADLDILAMSPHLQRDLGIEAARRVLRAEDYLYRK